MHKPKIQQKTERRISAGLRLALVAVLLLAQIALVVLLSMVLRQRMAVAYTVLELLAIAVAVRIYMMPGRSSSYKLGWFLLVLAVPVAGLILYFLWNGDRQQKRLDLKKKPSLDENEAVRGRSASSLEKLRRRCPQWGKLADYLCMQDFLLYQHTRVTYLPTGEVYLEDLLDKAEHAERFIFLEFFIVRTGKMWKGVEDILVRKAAQGVDVRLIYDDFGCLLGLPSDFVVKMERAHIRCIPFNPVVPLVSLVMNHRDHRKIVVVDGNTAYTGGINLADEYINEEERFGYWKDAALRTEGAAVWNFTVMFLDHWNAFRPSEEDYTPFMPQAEALSAQSDGVIQPYGDSPLDEEALAETVYLNIINQAQRYVYIYTPYFAVGETMLEALKAAAKRGVDVRLVLPGIPDKKLVFRLSRSYYLPLLQAGVRIYEYTPGFLHAKCWVSDDRAAVVGSINMDYRSLFLHFECGVLLQHNSQVAALRDDVRATLPQCREIHISDCRTSIPGTLLDSVLRLLSPLM